MDPTWLPVITGVLGAVAGIAGSALNPLLSSGQAHKSWLRDRRAVLYEEYFAALRQAMDTLFYDELAEPDLPKIQATARRLEEVTGKMPLYASEGLAKEADDVFSVYWAFMEFEVRMDASDQPRDERAYDRLHTEFWALAETVRASIRGELRVEPVSDRSLPERIAEKFKRI